MKNMPDTSISRVYQYLLSAQWFYTVSGTFLQKKSANMLGWNIFLIQGLSMLASPQTVKPPDKKPGISVKSSFMRRRSVKFQFVWLFGRTVLQHFPDQAASKAFWLASFIRKIPKILCVFGTVLWMLRFIDTMTCQQLVSVGDLS